MVYDPTYDNARSKSRDSELDSKVHHRIVESGCLSNSLNLRLRPCLSGNTHLASMSLIWILGASLSSEDALDSWLLLGTLHFAVRSDMLAHWHLESHSSNDPRQAHNLPTLGSPADQPMPGCPVTAGRCLHPRTFKQVHPSMD